MSPQLTLEAAILRRGGFASIPAGGTVEELVYVGLKGRSPAGETRSIKFEQGDPDSQAERAFAKLTEVALRFESPEQRYLPLVLSMWKTRYGTYDHLARVKEWSVAGDDDEAEASE
jgi:ATP-dependent helicase/nuclease subunit B